MRYESNRDGQRCLLMTVNAIGFLSGMAANWGTISSKRGYQGIIKKGIMWVWIVVANLFYLVLQDQGFQLVKSFLMLWY